MALVDYDGFDLQYDAATLAHLYGTRFVYMDNGCGVGIDTGRNGGKCLGITGTSSLRYARRLVGTYSECFMGVALQGNVAGHLTNNTLFRFVDGTNIQTSVVIDASKYINLMSGATVLAVSPFPIVDTGAWIYFDMRLKVDPTNGIFTVKMLSGGSRQVVSVSGVNTRQTANSSIDHVDFCTTNSKNVRFDDYHLCDPTGTRNNSFMGNTYVANILPSADGFHTDWPPSTGNRYACVNKAQAVATPYISSATPGAKASFVMGGTFPSIWGEIAAAQVVATGYQADDTNPCSISALLRRAGVDYVGSASPLMVPMKCAVDIFEVDPSTGLPWVQAAFAETEAGVLLVENS